METLASWFRPWGPYSLAALGAALIAFGLVSGLLLVRRHGSQFVRPYFMSAFGTAILVFVLAAMERTLLSGEFAAFKGLILLVTIFYGLALVRRTWRRPLAERSLTSYLLIALVCACVPAIPGVIGSIHNREEMIEAVGHSSPEVAAEIIRQTSVRIWTPLVAAATGGVFLVAATLVLVFRRTQQSQSAETH